MIAIACSSFLVLILVTRVLGSQNVCRTPQGDVGKCIQTSMCPQLKQRPLTPCPNFENMVCCPTMQRIVTPIGGGSSPVVPLPVPVETSTILPAPIIEVTTKIITPTQQPPGIKSVATTMCEQYKHRMKKRSSIVTYVFGGTASLAKEFPHMAILGYGTPENIDWLCGGSLISNQFILTAAHCLITHNVGELIRVRLGDLDLQSVTDDARPEDFGIAEKFIHPNYHDPSEYNDIALIKLDRVVEFSDYISPICLQTGKDLPNYNFLATGWGRTELGGNPSDILMKVDLDYFGHDACERNYANVPYETLPLGIVDDTQICAGSLTDEKDTCQGDSGGPLQIRDDVLYLVGITSFGLSCGIPNNPAVYTRVSYYIPWIEQIVWP